MRVIWDISTEDIQRVKKHIHENENAFVAKVNYRKYLLDGTMDLPASWHADHHSGDTIDKIESWSWTDVIHYN